MRVRAASAPLLEHKTINLLLVPMTIGKKIKTTMKLREMRGRWDNYPYLYQILLEGRKLQFSICSLSSIASSFYVNVASHENCNRPSLAPIVLIPTQHQFHYFFVSSSVSLSPKQY